MLAHLFRTIWDMERALDAFFAPWPIFGPRLGGRGAGEWPPLNVWETDDALEIECEMPGVDQKDIDLEVVQDEVTIRGARERAAEERAQYHRRERPFGRFARRLSLPVPVEADQAEARLADGVLRIRLPKAQEARSRKIEVKGA